MSQLNPVHSLVSYLFCVSCNTTHLSGFPTNVLYTSHAPRGVKWHFSYTVLINPVTCCEQCELRSSLLRIFASFYDAGRDMLPVHDR